MCIGLLCTRDHGICLSCCPQHLRNVFWFAISHCRALIDRGAFKKVRLHRMWHFRDSHQGMSSPQDRKTTAAKAHNDTQSSSKRLHLQQLLDNSQCRDKRILKSVGKGEESKICQNLKICFSVLFLWLVDFQGVITVRQCCSVQCLCFRWFTKLLLWGTARANGEARRGHSEVQLHLVALWMTY